jgi:hypothetical protein
MNAWQFMDQHPLLTIILALIVSGVPVRLILAIRGKVGD